MSLSLARKYHARPQGPSQRRVTRLGLTVQSLQGPPWLGAAVRGRNPDLPAPPRAGTAIKQSKANPAWQGRGDPGAALGKARFLCNAKLSSQAVQSACAWEEGAQQGTAVTEQAVATPELCCPPPLAHMAAAVGIQEPKHGIRAALDTQIHTPQLSTLCHPHLAAAAQPYRGESLQLPV